MGCKLLKLLVIAMELTNFDSILNKYEKQRINIYKTLELYGSDFVGNIVGADDLKKRYIDILNCGTQLEFIKDSTGIYRLKSANFCRQRICPMCQFRKSEKMFAEMMRVCELIGYKYRFLHLVLTVPNARDSAELVKSINLLYKGFAKFIGYKQLKRAFKGVLRCLEISYNYENDTYHPHLHCLVAVNNSYFNDTKSYINYEKMRELWSKACNSEQLLQIHIGAIKKGDYKGIAEVCKYCLKPLELDDDCKQWQNINVLLTLSQILKGQRYVQKYGVIKSAFNVIKEEKAGDIVEQMFDSEYFYWDSNSMKYKRG